MVLTHTLVYTTYHISFAIKSLLNFYVILRPVRSIYICPTRVRAYINHSDTPHLANPASLTHLSSLQHAQEHAGTHGGDRGASGKRGRVMVGGLHHAAWVCKDMKATVDFYESALGMRLRGIFPMHGVNGAKHCFLEAGNGAELSFVEFTGESKEPVSIAINAVADPGTQHHFAFKCDSMEQMHALRDQITDAGAQISPPLDHGMCYSAYFKDPVNGFSLEITCSKRGYKPSEYDISLLDRNPQPEEDLFHPDHIAFKNGQATSKSKL